MAELIPFPRRQRPEDMPTETLPVARRPSRAELRAADRRRMLENLAALVFLIAFMALSFWVIDRIGAYSRALDCMQFRHNKACR